MKRWIIAAMVTFFCYSCNNSEGAGSLNDRLSFQQEKQDTKDKKDKDKKDKDKDKDKVGKKKDKESKKEGKDNSAASGSLSSGQVWELPAVLTEISGTAWYSADKVAAVQDESGTIFIYDLANKRIEREIQFAGKGDYEGVAVAGNMFYVLRSDGVVIEVDEKGKSTEHKTHLTVKNDTEGLFLDKANNRLLIALKGPDAAHPGMKTVYSFDLSSKQMAKQPVLSIDLNDPVFGISKGKKDEVFQPSDLAIHPVNGDIYITDGANPALLVLTRNGEIKSYHSFDKKEFPQPEGITFAPDGTMYISTEGVKEKGKIAKVNIDVTDQITTKL